MIENIFREYDIRGIFETELNEISVKAIGYELGLEMKNRGVKTLSVGYDARLSANSLFNWLVSGLNKAEIKIFDIGMLPTPIGYFSVFKDFFDANIMITGSHNPKNYNGFKVTIFKDSYFGRDLQILKTKVKNAIDNDIKIEDNFKTNKFDVLTPYIEYLTKSFEHLKNLNLKIVSDAGNGTAGIVLEKLKENLSLNMEIFQTTTQIQAWKKI